MQTSLSCITQTGFDAGLATASDSLLLAAGGGGGRVP